MALVKICGIRREADIEYVNRHLPDYIGFVFTPSKRRITIDFSRYLVSNLNPRIKKAGIFVNEDLNQVVSAAESCELDAVQIHGDESPGYISELRRRLGSRTKVWKAVRVKEPDSIKSLDEYEADSYVLDAYSESGYGGAGITFDWNIAAECKKYGNIILAGGLNVQNLSEAIRTVSPYAVDVSSGVETEGFKDEDKIKKFIYAARCNVY